MNIISTNSSKNKKKKSLLDETKSELASLAEKVIARDIANSVDITKEFTEEEFENELDSAFLFLLYGSSWETTLRKNPQFRRALVEIEDIPLLCKGSECVFASKCQAIKHLNEAQRERLVGTDCREERYYGMRKFAEQIKNLHIQQEDSPDIILVTNLVKKLILQRRIGKRLSMEEDGLTMEVIDAISPISERLFFKRVEHPLHKEYERLEKQIIAIQRELMSTRKQRFEVSKNSGQKTTLDKMLELVRQAQSITTSEEKQALEAQNVEEITSSTYTEDNSFEDS